MTPAGTFALIIVGGILAGLLMTLGALTVLARRRRAAWRRSDF